MRFAGWIPLSMVAITFARCCAPLLLWSIFGNACAQEIAPDLDRINAAFRRAIDDESAETGRNSASPLSAALLDSMKVTAVSGCQPLDRDVTDCIVRIETMMRDGFRNVRLRREGSQWRMVREPDLAPPQPTLARAQVLLREHLLLAGAKVTDAQRAAEYRDFAAGLRLTELASCDLDRDSGALECTARFEAPGADNASQPVRFELRGGDWVLLPE